MIVKNIGATKKYFQFGPKVRGFDLEPGAQRFVPDSEVALKFAQIHVAVGDLAIVGGPAITTVLTPAVIPASMPVVITGDPTANDTITIDGVVFTFKAAADGLETTVVIAAADAAATCANLAAAVNGYTGVGFKVRAQAGVTIGADQACILYSEKPGTIGNGATNTTTGTGHTITELADNVSLPIANPAGGRDSQTAKVVTFTDVWASSPYQVFTGFDEIVNLQLTVTDNLGAVKAVTDTVKIEGGVVQLTTGGATPLAVGDNIHLTVTGK